MSWALNSERWLKAWPLHSHWVRVGELASPLGRALLEEQFRAVRTQLPFVNAVLCFTTVGGSVGYGIPTSAPLSLRVGIPLFLLAISFYRMIYWFHLRAKILSHEKILDELTRARVRVGLVSLGFSVWGLLLFEYADIPGQAYISAFTFLSAMCWGYCLACIPSIGGLIIGLAGLPVLIRLLMSADTFLVCMAFNFFLVFAIILRMMSVYFANFFKAVESRLKLVAERERAIQAEANALNEQAKARKIADTDALTGLANRRALLRSLELLITNRAAGFAVAMLDLDGFKSVNDSFGHLIGDAILVESGHRLSTIAGVNATVARLGGDEFCVLLPESSPLEAGQIGDQLCQALTVPLQIGNLTIRLSGSCGLALYPDSGRSPAQLMERADTALYYMKQRGRRGAAFFSHRMEDQLRRRTQIEQALHLTEVQDAIHLVFQPIIHLQRHTVRSFEALARWHDPKLGCVPPSEFIAIAEQGGLIDLLTEKLFDRALREASRWPPDIQLAFNLSAIELCSPTMPLKLASTISRHRFDPSRLNIELTETALLIDFRSARHTIEFLRDNGVKVILDDFGTGHSSIRYLRELAFDAIKIDGQFVQPIVDSVPSRGLLRGLVDLCAAINAPCIAEKVETAAHVQVLTELGCHYGQGFALAKPMPASDVNPFMSGNAESLAK